MAETAIFEDSIKTAAERILKSIPSDGEITAWELKTSLHLSSSALYLALGWLMNQGKIRLLPSELDYRITAAAAERPDATQIRS